MQTRTVLESGDVGIVLEAYEGIVRPDTYSEDVIALWEQGRGEIIYLLDFGDNHRKAYFANELTPGILL